MNNDFIQYQAQTSPYPLGMEVSHAIGSYIYDTNNNRYLDFVAGVSACSLGHQHPRVNQAIKEMRKQGLIQDDIRVTATGSAKLNSIKKEPS